MADPIKVTGLREFNRELRKLDATLPKAVRLLNLSIAEDVARDARARAESQGGVARKAAPSIKALAQQSRAQVKIGGARYPFALGAEFGSITYKQFKPWRGSGGDAGYSLYPAIRGKRERIADDYGRMLQQVARAAFPD